MLKSILTLLLPFLVTIVYAQEICNNGIDDDGDGLIDCFDGDCSESYDCIKCYETPVIDTIYSCNPDTFNAVGKTDQLDFISYEMEVSVEVNFAGFSPTYANVIGDIDQDTMPEIVTVINNTSIGKTSFFMINGLDGTIDTINTNFAYNNISKEIAIADIDNDCFGEIICHTRDSIGTNYYRLTCFEHDGTIKWRNTSEVFDSNAAYLPAYPNIADFNSDGIPEIYVDNRIYDGFSGTLIAKGESSRGGQTGPAHPSAAFNDQYRFSVAADVLPDNFCPDCEGLELIGGNVVYSVNINTAQINIASTAIPDSLTDGFTSVADFDADGQLDVIVNMNKEVYVWNPRTGNQIGSSTMLLPNQSANQYGSVPAVGNIDNDPELEVLVGNLKRFFAFDHNDTLLWKTKVFDASAAYTPSAVLFDFNGDGINEVVYRDADSLRIYDGNGNTLSKYLCISGTLMERPTIADVDRDGEAEIVCGCQNTPTSEKGIRVFNPKFGEWAPARPVDNQFAFSGTNINDDLTVPQGQQSTAHGSLNLNGYLMHTMLQNENGNSIYRGLHDTTFICIKDTIPNDTTSSVDDTNMTYDIFIPNAFSPNGNQANNFFYVINGDKMEGYYLSIYDRMGLLLFESENPLEYWDGKHKGKIVSSGSYVYTLQGRDHMGTMFTKYGQVAILE